MDTYEATKMVLTRIQSLDPENASKIMGYILIQDVGDKDLIRLAHGPDTLLVSLIAQAKSFLGLPSNTLSTPTNNIPFPQSTSPRIMIPNANSNGFHHHHPPHLNSPNHSSSPSSPWSNTSGLAAFSRNSPRPAASYASVVNGGGSTQNNNGNTTMAPGSSSSSLSFALHNANNNFSSCNLAGDEFVGNLQVQDQLSFFDESLHHHPIMSPSGRSDSSLLFPYGNCEDHPTPRPHSLHRRSCSVNDAFLVEESGGGGPINSNGGGWRPCMYYARGFCKNGSTCKFVHDGGGIDVAAADVGSPNKADGFDDLLRMKAIQQQRFAAASQLMASGPRHPFSYNNKFINLFNDDPRSAAAALMMGEEFQNFGRCRPDRNNLSVMGLDYNGNSSSRQIYLTFPADSTFKEEDVSNYFSMYGPVQDVRIPYQQKRMFGFVTFVYPETVKLILAKGNPHFVCDSRVLVKPYKEKGKAVEKKFHQQQLQLIDRGEFPACLSPTGFDSTESYDLPFGRRAFYNAQEMALTRKLEEQAELQQDIELQGRRLMNVQLMDLKNHYNNHQFHSICSPPALPGTYPCQTESQRHPNILPSDGINADVQEEMITSQGTGDSQANAFKEKVFEEVAETSATSDVNNVLEGSNEDDKANLGDADLHESLEHILPDNLFASPIKSGAEQQSLFASAASEIDGNASSTKTFSNNLPELPSASSTISTAGSSKLCHLAMARLSSG